MMPENTNGVRQIRMMFDQVYTPAILRSTLFSLVSRRAAGKILPTLGEWNASWIKLVVPL